MKLTGVVAGLAGEQRIDDRATGDEAEPRSVLRRSVGETCGCDRAAGAGHVLHDHGRIAGNVPAVVPRIETRGQVVAAARREPDHDRHLLAAEEVLRL